MRLDLRRPSRLVVVGDLRVPRITAAVENSAALDAVDHRCDARRQNAISQETGRLIVRFEADALDVTLPPGTAQGLVQGLRLADPSSIVIDLGPRFASFRAANQTTGNTARLVIDVLAAPVETANPPAPPTPPPSRRRRIFRCSVSRRRPFEPSRSIRATAATMSGASGAGGAVEKDLTLAVARRVKAAIEARLGVRVLLTRDDDRSVPLDERTAVANNNKADLFISLHANASFRADGSRRLDLRGRVRRSSDSAKRHARRPSGCRCSAAGSRDIELVPVGLSRRSGTSISPRSWRGSSKRQLRERVPLDVRADRPGAVPRARVGEHAGGPGRDGLPDAIAEQEKQLAGAEFQTAFVQARARRDRPVPRPSRRDGRRTHEARAVSWCRGSSRSPPSASAWLLFVRLPRWFEQRRRRRRSPRPARARAHQGRKIKAQLFYVADDGVALTGVERDVPFGEGTVEQAKAIVGAQIAPADRAARVGDPAGHDAARAVRHRAAAKPSST